MKKIQYVFYILLFHLPNTLSGSSLDKYGDRIDLLGITFRDPLVLCQILIGVFISIAFFQSGIDKIIDRTGNIEFLNVHFQNTFLKSFTPLLLSILTILELLGRATLIYGIYYAFSYIKTLCIFYGFVV